MRHQQAILFGDSHIGGINHIFSQNPSLFKELLSVDAKVHWVDNGMIAYNFTIDQDHKRANILNPILSMCFEQQGIYSRYTECWSRQDTTLVFLTGFAESHILSFRWEWQGYDFDLDRHEPSVTNILPHQLIKETIEHRLRPYFEGLQLIVDAGFSVYQVAGPPPHRDVSEQRRDFPFTLSPNVRRDIYNILVLIFSEMSARIGFDFVRSDHLADEEGFLRPDFEFDGVHTNIKGGEAILVALDTALRHLPGAALPSILPDGLHRVPVFA